MLKTTEPEVFGDANSLRLLINAVIDYAIYMIDLDGRVLTWNAGAVRLKSYSAKEPTVHAVLHIRRHTSRTTAEGPKGGS
jgi:PAS domain-containing protein